MLNILIFAIIGWMMWKTKETRDMWFVAAAYVLGMISMIEFLAGV